MNSKVILYFFLILLTTFSSIFVLAHASPPMDTTKQAEKIKQLFDASHVQGVIVINDQGNISIYGNAVQRASTQYVPASTFKMLNALIGLENNKVTPDEIFLWDGKKRALPAWEKNMTIGEAMRLSAVPVYQELARRIGLTLMQKEVKHAHFGNEKIGTKVDRFWLDGPLKITPIQESKFAYQLAYKQLPFKKTTQEKVQRMLLILKKDSYKIYAKSGLGTDLKQKVGWLTGWIEQPNGKKIAFSLNINVPSSIDLSLRERLVYRSLTILNII
ncbi:class D beta-lactamase [Commensalibacter oyaizuii]